jgi:hypothetical protein
MVKVRNCAITDENLGLMLEAFHNAAVDCDQLRVQVYGVYDVGDMQRPTISQAKSLVKWMAADTEDGDREDIFRHCIDVVAVMLRNNIIGKIARGLVKIINKMVQPQQPNQICCSLAEVDEYFATVTLPASVASTKKFTETVKPNAPVRGLNQTLGPVPGYVPRGSFSQETPKHESCSTSTRASAVGGEHTPTASLFSAATATFSGTALDSENASVDTKSPDAAMRGVGLFPVSFEGIVEEKAYETQEGPTSFFSWCGCTCNRPEASVTNTTG